MADINNVTINLSKTYTDEDQANAKKAIEEMSTDNLTTFENCTIIKSACSVDHLIYNGRALFCNRPYEGDPARSYDDDTANIFIKVKTAAGENGYEYLSLSRDYAVVSDSLDNIIYINALSNPTYVDNGDRLDCDGAENYFIPIAKFTLAE